MTKKTNKPRYANTLVIAATPYHIFTGVGLACSEFKDSSILFLLTTAASKRYARKLKSAFKDSDIDADVVCCAEDEMRTLQKADALASAFKFKTLKKPQVNIRCSNIVISSPSMLCAAIRQENKHAHVFLSEDGTGTYSGLIYKRKAFFDNYDKFSPANPYSFIGQVMCKGNLKLCPEALFAFAPEMIQPGVLDGVRIERLSMNETACSIAKKVFGSAAEDYQDIKAVFLGQGWGEIGIDPQQDLNELRFFERYLEKEGAFRPHPRDPRGLSRGNPFKCHVDVGQAGWETTCCEFDDNMVMVTVGSSAVFSPKMIYGKEPTVIFTYELHPDMDSHFKESFASTSNNLREVYSDKGKVIVPTSIDEFEAALRCAAGKDEEGEL